MDIINIVGTRNTSFTAQDGRQINGMSVFFTMPDDHVKGLMTGKHFISLDALDGFAVRPAVGARVQVVYNRYGKVDNYQAAPAEETTKR